MSPRWKICRRKKLNPLHKKNKNVNDNLYNFFLRSCQVRLKQRRQARIRRNCSTDGQGQSEQKMYSSNVSRFSQAQEMQKMITSFKQYNLKLSERLSFEKSKSAKKGKSMRRKAKDT